MAKLITYIGLDVHKETIAVALAAMGKREEVREYGKIPNTAAALKALAAKLARDGDELRFCYEAGPCGYGIQRQLTAAGYDCAVVAPSLIPRKPGERIKTDRRDAINLAKLHRAGELTAVWVPDQAHEAIRDLVRARQAAVRTLRQARQQLSGFLLRHGSSLSPAGLDAVAPALAGKPQVRPSGALYRAGRLYRGRRGGDGAARPTGGTYRSRVAGVVSRTGGDKHCKPCAAWDWWPRPHWWLSLATSRASPIPASSWRISVWCRPSTPAAARAARAGSPRPATERRDAC